MEHCHIIYPKYPSVVQVIQWINQNTFIDYFFVSSKLSPNIQSELEKVQAKTNYERKILIDAFTEQTFKKIETSKKPVFIYESLFTDDPLLTIISKIAIFIKKDATELVPYIWMNSPIRFKLNTIQWDGYNINPFKSLSKPNEVSNFEYISDSLFMTETVNIVFYEDFINIFKDNLLESYYFPNKKDILGLNKKIIKGFLNDHSLLTKLWYQTPEQHKNMIEKSVCILNRLRLNVSLPKQESLKYVFNNLHTDNTISFIQFVNDLNHIYYKVYKKHRIPEAYFDTWTNVDQMNGQSQIILYSFLQEKSILYAEIRIDTQYNMFISYKLDFSENISFERINTHIEKILAYFEKYLQISHLNVEIENISLRTTIQIPQANLKSISKYFASLLPLYNVPSKNRINKNILDLQFKRIPKYGQTKNIREYIKNKLALDIPILDILIDLQEYGLEESEVREYLEEIQQEQEKIGIDRKKKDIRNIGLIMHLSVVSLGIQINIDNASSFFDITNTLAWTRASLLAWKQDSIIIEKPKKDTIHKIEEEEDEEEDVMQLPIATPKSTDSTDSTDSDLSFGSEEQFGGAIGKEYNRYFNTLLKQIDPNIFALTENYARKCQVADLRQPIGITTEQKNIIDNSIYKDGYDNYIEYRSDPKKTNIYMCPRVWCPKSQVPLTPEQYNEGEGKCPREDEEPMLLFKHATWYNDVNRPHYIGFLKERGFNNVKLPCCFKKEQQQQTDSKQLSIKEKDEDSYIIDKIKNIPEARLGTIPQSLHEFLYPNTPYQLCKNTVKSNECLLRRGISSNKDSFLTSIAYLMNFTNKGAFLKHLLKELSPLLFITIENGLVYQTFQSNEPLLIEKETAMRKTLHKWLSQYPQYCKMFNLNDILPILLKDNLDDTPNAIRFKLARQLSIMDSYNRFIEYLKEDTEKNPHMFFDLFHHLGFLIIIWNRDSNSLATLKCPYSYKLKHSLLASNKLLPSILVMYSESSYEPLVIVDPSKNIQQRIFFSKYPKLEQFLIQCPSFKLNDDTIIQKLYSLNIWSQKLLDNPSGFVLNTIILDYNYRIYAFMTKEHIWVDLPEPIIISSLSYILELLSINQILYWEDIQGLLYDIKLYRNDFTLWSMKLKTLGLGHQVGEIKNVNKIHFETLLKIPTVTYPDLPNVPIVLTEPFIQRLDTIQYDNSQWYKTKKYILYTLIKDYDTIVKPLLGESKNILLNSLYEIFNKIQQPSRVAVLLEEIPLSYKESLEQLYQELLLEKPYYHQPNKIYDGYRKKEWIFTQHAINFQDMMFIKNPGVSYNITNFPTESKETLQQKNIIELSIPNMINESLCNKISFPTKWRATIWKNYDILLLKTYDNASLYQYIQWVVQQHYQYWNIDDIQLFLKKLYLDLLEDRTNYPKLFEDPSMRIAWNHILQRNYRNTTELIELGLHNLSISEIKNKWQQVISTQYNNIWVNDFDLYHISDLFKISFFIIIKGKSADKKTDDMLSSIKFISGFKTTPWMYRPLIVLYKQISEDKTYNIYGSIIKDKKSYYRQGIEAPTEIKTLIEDFIQMSNVA